MNKRRITKFLIISVIFLLAIFLLLKNVVFTNVSEDHNLSKITKDEEKKDMDYVPVKGINVPDNFLIHYYTEDVPNARSMVLSESGVLFVGTRKEGKVYGVLDENKDGIADDVFIIASGLNNPNGVAYKNGDLFVAEINRILKFSNIEDNFKDKPDYDVIYDKYPSDTSHGWKYIAFGPDNRLYVPVGAPCNICKREEPIYSTITSINIEGVDFRIEASGIRNTVGFDWHPETNELWFTDNGRDWMGDDLPPDELNLISGDDNNFGYPYCHGKDIADPDFGSENGCDIYTPAMVELGPHVAALGMTFYTGDMFPEEYKQKIFIAEHGSWNRSTPIGYRVTTVDLNEEGSNADNYMDFATGWLDNRGKVWGRPVDVIQMDDGSILVSDDKAGAVYRIVYLN